MSIDWSLYPNFKEQEFRCKHTGRMEMQENFIARLQALRYEYNKPMVITSGYRHTSHPIERVKNWPGAHTFGRAVDIAAQGDDAYRLVPLAIKHGFTGIGVNIKGAGRFIHLDDMPADLARPRPWLWSYP